jgi:hypothetical protein
MKRIFCLLTVAILLSGGTAFALDFKSNQEVLIPAGQVIDDDLFAAGSKVVIDGTVNGDVFAFAGEVVVRGRINGELFAFAGTVSTSDTIRGPARIFAGNIKQSGHIAGNYTVFGGKVRMIGSLGRDAAIRCGQADISGAVGRDLDLEAKQASVSGAVGNDASLRARSLTLGKLAVGRDLVYKTPARFDLPADVVARGKTAWEELPVAKPHASKSARRGIGLFLRWIWFLGALVVGLILIAVSRKQSLIISETIKTKFWQSLGFGALWLTLLPIAAIIAGLTLVGLPLAVFGLFAYCAVLYLGAVFFGLLLGRMTLALFKKPDASPYLAFVIGITILFVLTLLPFLGIAVRLFVAVAGGGAAVLSRFAFLKELRAAGTI